MGLPPLPHLFQRSILSSVAMVWINPSHNGWLDFQNQSKVLELDEAFILYSLVKMGKDAI